MDTVTVAELKARLSHYLREVREGRSFTVLSRDIPVATLGPHEAEGVDDLEIIGPTEDPALWGRVDLPPAALSRDIVDYLIAVRQDRDLGVGGPSTESSDACEARGGRDDIVPLGGSAENDE